MIMSTMLRYFVHILGLDAPACNSRLDRSRAKLRSSEGAQTTIEETNGCAHGGYDDDVAGGGG